MFKDIFTGSYTFNPSTKTLDLSGIQGGFDLRRLYAVINDTTGDPIYIMGSKTLNITNVTSGVVTFGFDTTGMQSTDKLTIFYHNPSDLPVSDSTSQAILNQIKNLLNNPLTVSGNVTANLGTIDGAATSAKQDSQTAVLNDIDSKINGTNGLLNQINYGIGGQVNISELALYDPTINQTYIRRETENVGSFAVSWLNLDETPATPTISNLIGIPNYVINTVNVQQADSGDWTVGARQNGSWGIYLTDLNGINYVSVKQSNSAPTSSDYALTTNSVSYGSYAGTYVPISVNSDGTVNVSLASTPLPAGASTSALQTSSINLLSTIASALSAQASLVESMWYDPASSPTAYYFRRVVDNGGSFTVTWVDKTESTVTPSATWEPVANNSSVVTETTSYTASSSGTGYSNNDLLLHVSGVDKTTSPPSVAFSFWFNATTNVVLSSPPTGGTYALTIQNVSDATTHTLLSAIQTILQGSLTINLPSGAATSANQPAINGDGGALSHVTNFPTTYPVTGTFWQTTQPVSLASLPPLVASSAIVGKVGIDQTMPGTTNGVQINAALPAGTNIIGSVKSASSDVSPVSQNITVVDSGSSVNTGSNNQSIITGSPTSGSVASFSFSGVDTISVQVSGSWTGTLQTEVTPDGSTWYIRGIHLTGTTFTVSTNTANFGGILNVAGMVGFRVRATAAMTGTATVNVIETNQPASSYIANQVTTQPTYLAPIAWTGSVFDARTYNTVTVYCTTAPTSNIPSIQRSPDNVKTPYTLTAIINNSSGITTTTSLNSIGEYTIPGGGYISLSTLSSVNGGTFMIGAGQ